MESGVLLHCPRCKHDYPIHYFEMPVSLSLVCYSKQRGNLGLTLSQLRTKAKRSNRAKDLNKPGRYGRITQLMLDQLASGVPIINEEEKGGDVDESKSECENCQKPDPNMEFNSFKCPDLKIKILCPSCIQAIRDLSSVEPILAKLRPKQVEP